MYIYKLTYVHVHTGHTLLCYYRLVYLPMGDIYTIGLENEYLDDWDRGKNLFLAVRSLRCCSDATRTEVYSQVRIYTMCIVNLKLPSSLCSQIIH